MWHERTTCRLCDAALPAERILDLGATPLANALEADGAAPGPDYPLFLKQCTSCGHCQLPVVVDPKLLFPADYPYQSATGASMREHLERMAEQLAGGMVTGELVAEIGSNDGYLLGQFGRCHLRTVGIDPALTLASSATRDGSLTVPEFFSVSTAHAVRNACGPASLIVANNVFAHADDLHEIVEGVKVLLAPEGRFVFEVGYLPDVLRTNNFGTVYHEHLSYHTLGALAPFFVRHDMRIYDATPVATQGGSIRCFVARTGSRHAIPEALAKQVFPAEQALPELLAGWQSRVKNAADALHRLLANLYTAGKSVAGYGCSAKSATLLHVANIDRELIDFICDDAPTKQGKFSPGKHIPIVPGSWLEEKQPDYCVSLSGNFSEAFKAAHPEFKGEWIEPDLGGA